MNRHQQLQRIIDDPSTSTSDRQDARRLQDLIYGSHQCIHVNQRFDDFMAQLKEKQNDA